MSDDRRPASADLLGTWRLESWALVYDDGRADEHPLGAEADGFIMYTADGHVSAMLSRAGRSKFGSGDAGEKARAYDDSFAYAGRYEVRDGAVFHSIEVSTNPALPGFTSMRKIILEGDRLTLTGPDFLQNAQRSQRIIWRRAVHRA